MCRSSFEVKGTVQSLVRLLCSACKWVCLLPVGMLNMLSLFELIGCFEIISVEYLELSVLSLYTRLSE